MNIYQIHFNRNVNNFSGSVDRVDRVDSVEFVGVVIEIVVKYSLCRISSVIKISVVQSSQVLKSIINPLLLLREKHFAFSSFFNSY